MEQTLATATLPLVGVIVGAGLQYWFGRALETKKQVALQRVQAYSDYFKSAAQLSKQGRTPENMAFATDAKVRVCLYGSANVVRRLHDLDLAGNDLSRPEGAAAVTALLAEMRRDGGAASGLIADEILRVVLLGPEKSASG